MHSSEAFRVANSTTPQMPLWNPPFSLYWQLESHSLCLSVPFPPLRFEERDYDIACLLSELYLNTEVVSTN